MKKVFLFLSSFFLIFLAYAQQIEDSQSGDRLYTDIQSVFVLRNNIYAAGSTCVESSLTDIPTLWINGNPQAIGNEGNFNKATSVFVAGDDVYVTINESNSNQAFLWKNGESQLLAEGIFSKANCVYVNGDDVYVAGQKDEKPTLWKNGVPQTLGENGEATTVLVRDNGVYVAGFLRDDRNWLFGGDAFLYVFQNNGDKLTYDLGMSRAYSIFVTDDGKVYVAGTVNLDAALWENGNLTILGGPNGSAYSVAVNNADTVVVTGDVCDPLSSAVVWVNGQRNMVHDIMRYQAMSVVTDGKSFYIGGCSNDGMWAVYEYDGISTFRSDNLKRVPMRLTLSEINANETPQTVAYSFVHSIIVNDYTTMAKLCTDEFNAELNESAESKGITLPELFTSQYIHDIVHMRPVVNMGYDVVIYDSWQLDTDIFFMYGKQNPYAGLAAFSVSFTCADANGNLYDGTYGDYDITARVLLVKIDGKWKVFGFK